MGAAQIGLLLKKLEWKKKIAGGDMIGPNHWAFKQSRWNFSSETQTELKQLKQVLVKEFMKHTHKITFVQIPSEAYALILLESELSNHPSLIQENAN